MDIFLHTTLYTVLSGFWQLNKCRPGPDFMVCFYNSIEGELDFALISLNACSSELFHTSGIYPLDHHVPATESTKTDEKVSSK